MDAEKMLKKETKTFRKLEIRGNSLHLVKGIYEKLRASTILW